MYRRYTIIAVLALLMVGMSTFVSARDAMVTKIWERTTPISSTASPYYQIAEHNVGKLVLSIANNSGLGTGYYYVGELVDCFTGQPVRSCEFPAGSDMTYLFGATLWIGAVVGSDTLVSVGADGWWPARELHPDALPYGNMIFRSTLDPEAPEYAGAVSEQDYIAVYTDTLTAGMAPDEVDYRPHIPLNVEITQKSYAWSYPYSEDVVLINYDIRNIGYAPLQQVYAGLYVDGDVHGLGEMGFTDDIAGFGVPWETYYNSCHWTDTLNAAWIADNDGDINWVPNVTGMRVLGAPVYPLDVSFNWWISNGDASRDFGPQQKDHLRYMVGGVSTGTPAGDRNKYFVMSNGETDYDQIFTRMIGPEDPVWAYPNQTVAGDITDGLDTRYLLSFGPFDINPGETAPVTVAYIGGQNLHVDPYNFMTYLYGSYYDPHTYYSNLNFTDFAFNCKWAEWIYDNPGFDTDADGYAGAYTLCEGDTIWTSGDGVPDFQPAAPPPAPEVRVEPRYEGMRITWNGVRSETTPDPFSRSIDFEGYNVYLSQFPEHAAYALIGSYDVENYNKYVWNLYLSDWELHDRPFTPEELRCLYAASCEDMTFDPRDYPRFSPYLLPGFPDSAFAFEPFGANRSDLGPGSRVHKIYPNQPYPTSLDPAQANADELTEDGYLKYFEYEVILSRLLGGACYYVNVTATDHGSPRTGVTPLETSRMKGAIHECAMGPVEVDLDIMYWQCPNVLDVTLIYEKTDEEEGKPRGGEKSMSVASDYFNCAILGSPEFDVHLIDPETIRLHTWQSTDARVFDVATPVPSSAGECECHTLQQDGYDDLIFTVRKPFGLTVPPYIVYGDQIPLNVTGRLLDGREFIGTDCVLLTRTSEVPPESSSPRLIGNYPNPFNPSTEIAFTLPAAGPVKLEIYNVIGQKVATLVDGVLEAGYHSVEWDGKEMASGLYVYRLEAGGVSDSKKMLLVK